MKIGIKYLRNAGLIVACCIFISAAGVRLYSLNEQARQKRMLREKKKFSWNSLHNLLEYEAARFDGKAGVVIRDLADGWEIALNKKSLFPSASLVKIPIMAVCFQAESEGRLRLDEKIVLRTQDKTGGSGILKNSPAGTVLTVEKLMELMITKSDNTACNLLIDRVGLRYCNDSFKRMGLSRTNLSRKMMDFSLRGKGVENYTTCEDISLLLERMYRGSFLGKKVSERCVALLLNQKINDRIPAKLPETVKVAHKTGLERHVCHDAGIVYTPAGDFLICVLTSSNQGSRKVKEFISTVSLYIYRNYENLYTSARKEVSTCS